MLRIAAARATRIAGYERLFEWPSTTGMPL
jgi:hypothetical protein